MFIDIGSYLINVVGGLFVGACLLRLYMQLQRVPFHNPVGRLIFALTDWLVMPLRRVIPPTGRWDVSSLVAAVLLQLVQQALLVLLVSAQLWGMVWAWLPWSALFALAYTAISGLMGLLIVYVVLSWVPTSGPMAEIFSRLCDPLLRPIRRVVPLLGGVDLSPFVLGVLLQVLLMALPHVQRSVL